MKIPEVSILEPGRVVIPGKVFYDIIRHLPPGDLELGTDEEKKAFTIKGTRSFFQLHLLPEEEYPPFTGENRRKKRRGPGSHGLSFTGGFFPRSRQEYGFTLPCLRIHGLSSPVSSRNLTSGNYAWSATDINRLVVKDISIEEGEKEFSTMIPVNSLREMANILAYVEDRRIQGLFPPENALYGQQGISPSPPAWWMPSTPSTSR